MKKIGLLAFVSVLLLLSLVAVVRFAGPVTASLPVHNVDTGLDYATIQEAINANETLDGHTILVNAGIYYENVVVNKSISLVGEGKETTIIDGNMSGTVVHVKASGVLITNFTIRNGLQGVRLSSNVIIRGNNITNNSLIGVWLFGSSNCTVSGNNITNNGLGVSLIDSPNCTISENYVSNNSEYGFYLFQSPNVTMSENALNGNKFGFGVEGYELSHFMLSIDTSNLVNGKPVYYLVNRRDLVMNSSTYPDVGYLALVNSSNIAVEGLTLANNGQGLLLAFTNDSRITDNNITDNEYGIWLGYSSNNSVSGNTFVNCGLIVFGYELGSYRNRVENNTVNGKPLVYLESVSDYVIENAGQVILINSSCILVENLDLSNATVGVWLWRTDSTKIVGNNLTNNLWGVFGVARGGGSLNSTISGNNITNNRFGIGLSSRNSTVSGNYVSDNLYGVWLFESANSTVTANNITNNNYLGVMVGADSDGSTISGNYVSKNGHADDIMSAGITLGSANVVVERNTIIDNYLGVRLNSPRNLLRENNISSNVEGIRIAVSPGYEQIYHNNFIENEVQVGHPEWVDPSTIWDSGYPSGGNYWSDYNGTDLLNGPDQNETGSDGIGDTAYSIDAYVIDNYPLMGMFYAFNATWQEETYRVNVISNSSVSGFDFRAIVYFETGEWLREIHFNVAGKDGTSGFCRITIPTALMNDTYTVFVNGTEVPYILLPFSNSTHSYLYFTYNHSTQEVVIIPEFPTWTPMLLILIILTVTIAITKRRLLKTPIR